MGNFRHVKTGDTVMRVLDTRIMHLKVTEVDDDYIYCGIEPFTRAKLDEPWRFDRGTGVEEDPELKYGVRFGLTCSFLMHPCPVPVDSPASIALRKATRIAKDTA